MTAIRRAVSLTATVFALSVVGPPPALAHPPVPFHSSSASAPSTAAPGATQHTFRLR